MSTKKEKPKARPDCPICRGKGWFYAGHEGAGWPTECHRCFPLHPNVRTKGATPNAQQQR